MQQDEDTKNNGTKSKNSQKKPDKFQKDFFNLLVNEENKEKLAEYVSKYTFIKFDGNKDKKIINCGLREIWDELEQNKGKVYNWKAINMPKLNAVKERFEKLYIESNKDLDVKQDVKQVRYAQQSFEMNMEKLNEDIKSKEIEVNDVIECAKNVAFYAYRIFECKLNVLNKRVDNTELAKYVLLLALSNEYSKLQERLKILEDKLGKNPIVNRFKIKKIKSFRMLAMREKMGIHIKLNIVKRFMMKIVVMLARGKFL